MPELIVLDTSWYIFTATKIYIREKRYWECLHEALIVRVYERVRKKKKYFFRGLNFFLRSQFFYSLQGLDLRLEQRSWMSESCSRRCELRLMLLRFGVDVDVVEWAQSGESRRESGNEHYTKTQKKHTFCERENSTSAVRKATISRFYIVLCSSIFPRMFSCPRHIVSGHGYGVGALPRERQRENSHESDATLILNINLTQCKPIHWSVCTTCQQQAESFRTNMLSFLWAVELRASHSRRSCIFFNWILQFFIFSILQTTGKVVFGKSKDKVKNPLSFYKSFWFSGVQSKHGLSIKTKSKSPWHQRDFRVGRPWLIWGKRRKKNVAQLSLPLGWHFEREEQTQKN